MNDLIRNIVFGIAIAAVVVAGLSLPGEPESTIARCAAMVVKMPCL